MMQFDPNSYEAANDLGVLGEATPVTVDDSATSRGDYSVDGGATGSLTAKQFVRPANETRPVVIFFYCSVIQGEKMCSCEVIRRMAFSDVRTTAHVGNFRWLEIDVDDARNADILQQFRVTSSPTLVFCDPLGNEVGRVEGPIHAGRLINELTSALGGSGQTMGRNDRTIADMNGKIVDGWRLLGAGDCKGAVREFRRLQAQATRLRYRSIRVEAERGLEACKERGIARVRQVVAQGGEDVVRNLNALREEFPGIREVRDAIGEALASR
ncbi:MAG: hypothetical protein HY608_00540 [Planctomycetes bacterium]|nr:hypothetical protein [Planctomycetota bacterium]